MSGDAMATCQHCGLTYYVVNGHNCTVKGVQFPANTYVAYSGVAPWGEVVQLRAEVARLKMLQAIRDDAQLHYYQEAERRVRQYGVEPGWLQHKWRTDPPANFDQQECTAAVLDALNREGVPAGDGDAIGCVVQMIEAQRRAFSGGAL